MGEGLKRVLAAGFLSRTTRGLDKMRVPRLIAEMRPECLERRFSCSKLDDSTVDVGDDVLLRAEDGVTVLRGSAVVGSVEAEDIECIMDALTIAEGWLPAKVCEVSPFDDGFTVKINEGEEGDS